MKAPRAITHERRLVDVAGLLETFLSEARRLGDKLGPLLVQLPPSLVYDPDAGAKFFTGLRDQHDGPVACEPRHPTWFEADADEVLRSLQIARVAADPARHPLAGEPGGWPGLSYWRLHGSPRMYYSEYSAPALAALAGRLREGPDETWCIFDNTTSGAAASDALALGAHFQPRP